MIRRALNVVETLLHFATPPQIPCARACSRDTGGELRHCGGADCDGHHTAVAIRSTLIDRSNRFWQVILENSVEAVTTGHGIGCEARGTSMPAIDLEALTAPVSADDPCGPDLDLAGDSEYLNFLAGAEGRLPSSYFDGKDDSGAVGRPFMFTKVELDAAVAGAGPLLDKTRDLRLLVLLAKYALLGRELGDFITLIKAVAALLSEQWDGVHPRAEDGEFQLRAVAVELIELQATIIMPLQFAPLIEHRRLGTLSYRSHMIASGTIPPREGEDVVDLSGIDRMIRETEVAALVTRRSAFIELQTALNGICQTWSDKGGSSVQLDKLIDIVGKIVAFLDGAVTSHDPSAGLSAPKGGEADGAADADQDWPAREQRQDRPAGSRPPPRPEPR